jgi:hypothetical protein
LPFTSNIGEVHARLGVVSKHVRERRLAGRIEVAIDVAEVDDARRYQVNGCIFKVLVEAVVVAVADDGVRNRLGVGNLVIGLPANLGQGVVAAALRRQSWGELQDTLTDGMAKTGGVVPILSLQVVDKDALAPLAERRDDGGDAFAATAGSEQENWLRARVQQVVDLQGVWVSPAADVHPVRCVKQAQLLYVFARSPGCGAMQVHQAVGAFAVADEGEKPVGEIGQKESAYDGRPKCNPEVLANARTDKAAASVVLPEYESRKGLEDCRAVYPQDGIAHLDWIVELKRKPLGCGTGGQDECNRRSNDRSDIPAALPTWTVGENVSGRRCRSVSHGMPPGIEEYIPLPPIAKSVPSVPRPVHHPRTERVVELSHPSLVGLADREIHGAHPAHNGIKRLSIAKNVFVFA